MPKRSKTPAITQTQFDRDEKKLRSALRKWWEDEAEDFDAAVRGAKGVWKTMMPEIDSKAVVKASPVIKRFLGVELDPRLIKKGGYSSFDDLADDLLPKLRTACPVGTSDSTGTSRSTSAAIPPVARASRTARKSETRDVRRS